MSINLCIYLCLPGALLEKKFSQHSFFSLELAAEINPRNLFVLGEWDWIAGLILSLFGPYRRTNIPAKPKL